MLAEFKVRNYKNFKDELQFSLKSAKNYEFRQEVLQNGIIKDAVVIGYNASGKTNLGLAMMDITAHLTDKFEKRDGNNLFYANLYNAEDVVSFVYQFKFDQSVLEYAYEKKNVYQVFHESIRIDGKEVIRSEKKYSFVDLKGAETLNQLGRFYFICQIYLCQHRFGQGRQRLSGVSEIYAVCQSDVMV